MQLRYGKGVTSPPLQLVASGVLRESISVALSQVPQEASSLGITSSVAPSGPFWADSLLLWGPTCPTQKHESGYWRSLHQSKAVHVWGTV